MSDNVFPKKRLISISSMYGETFMHAAGSAIFGDKWSKQHIAAKVSPDYPFSLGGNDTAENRKTFVLHQILAALASGRIVAQIQIADVPLWEVHYRLWVRDPDELDFKNRFTPETVIDFAARANLEDDDPAIDEFEANQLDGDMSDEELEKDFCDRCSVITSPETFLGQPLK